MYTSSTESHWVPSLALKNRKKKEKKRRKRKHEYLKRCPR
jgi:hypothetical protein